MKAHDYSKYSAKYAELGIEGTYYLEFRDIPTLFKRNVKSGNTVLDYGCGTGRSTRFLKNIGYDVIGVDISQDMINQANKYDATGHYELIENAKIPYADKTFDVVFSSYVFLEIGSFSDMIDILNEMKRVLKDDGCIIFITSIVTNIKDRWVSFSYDFAENDKPLNKCQQLKLLIKNKNIIFYDYNWTDKEYRDAINMANLQIKDVHIPMGTKNDGIDWEDETTKPYAYIYTLKKK